MDRTEDSQDSEGQSHHADKQAMQADVERAFQRAYQDWKCAPSALVPKDAATESDWALIAWGLGVTDLYKRLK